MKALIIGSNSPLGVALSNELKLQRKFDIFKYTRNPDANSCKIDAESYEEIYQCLSKLEPDLIFNLVSTYSSDFDESYNSIYKVSENILKATYKLKLKSRIVLMGSAAEYGVSVNASTFYSETQVLEPTTALI